MKKRAAGAVFLAVTVFSLAGCGSSKHLLTADAVQRAFNRAGLHTHIPWYDCPNPNLLCPRDFITSHIVAVVVNDQPVSRADPEDSVQAWVFRSVEAADAFRGPTGPAGAKSLRLVRQANVVVQVDPAHKRRVKAALATLR